MCERKFYTRLQKNPKNINITFTADEVSKGDLISNEMIKTGSPTILPFLVTLFNTILETKRYPEDWTCGIITPIHKLGETDNPDNYRGITINSCLSKLFNLLLTNRLTSFVNEKGILKYNQIGFRKDFCTADHVLTIKTIIDKYLSKNIIIDFRKAYDSILREGLFDKLYSYGVTEKFIAVLENMYSKVQLSVSLPNGITNPFTSNIGLKQGCNLGPILFNLFINDINDIFDSSLCQPPMIYQLTLNNLLYADDLVLLSETSLGLQTCLDKLQQYCYKWKLTVNTRKTKTMIVAKRQVAIANFFTFNGNVIETCKSYTYLGSLISNNGQFKLNISELCKSASRAMYTLLGNLNKFSSGNVTVILNLFDKMILPICTYNCEVWGVSFFPYKFSTRDFLAEKQLKNPIDKLQGSFLKRTLGVNTCTSNWAVKSETNRNSILIKIIKRMIEFWSHIKETESEITQDTLKLANKIHNEGNTSWLTSIVKIAEIVGINQDILGESKKHIDQPLTKQLKKMWYSNNEKYSQGKLKLYTSFKEHPGFENYLNESNPKLCQAITKIRISAHNFPTETDHFENKNQTNRICPLCCEGIGNELHYLIECKNKAVTKT